MTDLERIRDIIHDLSVAYGSRTGSTEDYDQMSLEQFVVSKGGSQKTIEMIRIWSRVMLGVEATELSAQYFIEYNGKGGGLKTLRSDQKGGGQYLRFRKGTFLPTFQEKFAYSPRNTIHRTQPRHPSPPKVDSPLSTCRFNNRHALSCDCYNIYWPHLQIQKANP